MAASCHQRKCRSVKSPQAFSESRNSFAAFRSSMSKVVGDLIGSVLIHRHARADIVKDGRALPGRFVSPCPCYIGRAAPSIARLAVNPIWPHTDVSIALRMVLSTERVEWVIKRGHSQNQKKATDGERRLRHIQIKLASSASDCRPRRVFWRYCHARRIRQCQEDQPMSNVRDEQRALRDEQRAAIKAAVASANAIIPNLGWHRRAWHGVDTSHNRPTPRRAEEAARHTDADPGSARDWTPAGSAESSR